MNLVSKIALMGALLLSFAAFAETTPVGISGTVEIVKDDKGWNHIIQFDPQISKAISARITKNGRGLHEYPGQDKLIQMHAGIRCEAPLDNKDAVICEVNPDDR